MFEPSANQICRCCLKHCDPVFQMTDLVFEEFITENRRFTAFQCYTDVTGLMADQIEMTSLQICNDCKSQLQKAFSFREQCLGSHKLLSCVKQEYKEVIFYEENAMLAQTSPVSVKLELCENLDGAKEREIKGKSKQIKKATAKKLTKTKARIILGSTSANRKPVYRGGGAIDFFSAKFLCQICDAPAKNYAHLIKHRRNHSNYTHRDCKQCGQEKVEDYEEHLGQVHPEYRPQKCLQCDASYVNHKDLKVHLSTHMDPEVHDCKNCGARFDKLTWLRRHVGENCGKPIEEKATYNCHVCGLAFTKVKDFQQHVYDTHPEEFRKYFFPCFRCKRILVGQQKYTVCAKCEPWRKKREKKMKAQNISPHFECTKCKQRFYEEEEFLCHQIGNHNMRSYCFQCDKPFWNRNEKRVHDKQVHAVEKVRNTRICETCGKDFKTNYYLEKHILSHKAKPHLKCTYPGCEGSFYIQSVLNRHVVAKHQKDYKYECHYCGKRINFYGYIMIHLARAHFPHLRKYVCDHNTCIKRFASITDKKRHMAAVHTIAYPLPDKVTRKKE